MTPDLKDAEVRVRDLQVQIPNLTHPDAPVGGEDAVRVERVWGEKPAFDFQPLDHVALMEKLDLVDLDAGSKVAGHGFYYLKNEAVLLELALIQYAVHKLRREGFTLFTTPDLARDEVLEGIGFLPRGDGDADLLDRRTATCRWSPPPRSRSAACSRTRS